MIPASFQCHCLLLIAGLSAAGWAIPVHGETRPDSAHSVITAGHTAHWYDPAREGEGWSLEILSEEHALAYWFTYDEQGNPRWLIGTGDIIDNRIEFPELFAPSGASFGADFDPDDVEFELAGSATMHFSDCDSGWVEFDAFGQVMSTDLARLTRTMLVDCNPPEDQVVADRAHQSGSWYDSDHEGEGYTLQWLVNGLALVTWFSFDAEGNPYWMQAVGEVAGGSIHFPDVYSTRGPVFGAGFSSEDLEVISWGALTMTLECETGAAQYDSVLVEFGQGSFELDRLTIPAGLTCQPSGPGEASWEVFETDGPALSELPAAVLGDFIYVGGGMASLSESVREFWRFQPSTGQWARMADLPERRDHGMMAALDGRIYFFGGYRNVLTSAGNNTWRYEPGSNSWSSLTPMPASRAAGGAAALGDHIYVAGGAGSSQMIFRFTPATNAWQSFQISDSENRDHAAVVAYQGEIWLLGGRGIPSGGSVQTTIFDPQTGTSRAGPSMHRPRSGFSAAVVDGHIVVAGGELFQPPQVIESVEAYSPETGWVLLAPLPIPVHGAGGAGFGSGFYVMPGSVVANDIINNNRVQRLVFPSPGQ